MFIANHLDIKEEIDDLSLETLANVIISDNFGKYEYILSDIENKVDVEI